MNTQTQEALENKDKILKDFIKHWDIMFLNEKNLNHAQSQYWFNQYRQAYKDLKQIIENDNIKLEVVPEDRWGYQYGM